jgi:UDP-N-acetylglucosamine 2-epimerase (non-hydrolysing)
VLRELEGPGGLSEMLKWIDIDFLALETKAALVVTHSGGVQEETSYLGIPCLTVRPNTEGPVTVRLGTNRLLDPSVEPLPEAVRQTCRIGRRSGPCPIEGWDGKSAGRIVLALREMLRL